MHIYIILTDGMHVYVITYTSGIYFQSLWLRIVITPPEAYEPMMRKDFSPITLSHTC